MKSVCAGIAGVRPIVPIAGDAGSMTIAVLVGGSTVATHTAVSIIATAINGTTAMPTVTAVTIVGAEVAAEDVINKRRKEENNGYSGNKKLFNPRGRSHRG